MHSQLSVTFILSAAAKHKEHFVTLLTHAVTTTVTVVKHTPMCVTGEGEAVSNIISQIAMLKPSNNCLALYFGTDDLTVSVSILVVRKLFCYKM